MVCKFQRSAVFGHCADYIVRGAGGNIHLDFQGYSNGGPNQANQVGDDFIGNPAGVSSDAGGI